MAEPTLAEQITEIKREMGKAKGGGFRQWRRFDGTIVHRDQR